MSRQAEQTVSVPAEVKHRAEDTPSGVRALSVVASPDEAANEQARPDDEANNLIKRTVQEICTLLAEAHDFREDILAHGIKFHMLNNLVELGINGREEELARMKNSAVEASADAHGPQGMSREELDQALAEIVTLEKDLRHVRHVASRQGIHMQALNHLTQLMRQNPGDGGVQAINTFVAYADAAGVPLDRVASIRNGFEDEPDSVLPDIPRESVDDSRNRGEQLANVLIGLGLTALVMWMVL